MKEKEKNIKKNNLNNIITKGNNFAKTKIIRKTKKNNINFPPKKSNLKFVNNYNIKKKINKRQNKKYFPGIKINSIQLYDENKKITKTNQGIKSTAIKTIQKQKKQKHVNIKLKPNIIYKDFELNFLDYKNAIINDKRTFCESYLSLLKNKNLILFSFCPKKDYNSMIIKLCIFSLSFSTHYAVNFAFFNDDTLHQIYKVGGKYDVMFFLPKIVISSAISYIISSIIKHLFLSERNIFKVKIQPLLSKAQDTSYKEKKCLIIKYSIFFISGLIFLGFFWLFLSAFGAVYQNTQIFIFKNALISFTLSLFFPFFINIFTCLFRLSSLNSKTKDSEYLFKMSKILQIL